jgi:hypothetical protein
MHMQNVFICEEQQQIRWQPGGPLYLCTYKYIIPGFITTALLVTDDTTSKTCIVLKSGVSMFWT